MTAHLELSCENCGKTFTTLDDLSNHRKEDHNCDDTFSTINTLNEHTATKHQNSGYGGGNLFDDIQVHVMTMSTVEEQQHPEESTIMLSEYMNYEDASAS